MTEIGTAQAQPGRRERKKAATRQALADAALRLFVEHGYDQVTIRDVAEAADVSTTTLFKHFPGKEALVFDRDAEIEAVLVAAVRQRPPGWSIPRALCKRLLGGMHVERHPTDPQFAQLTALVDRTPALQDYFRRILVRHEHALAKAIAEEVGVAPDDSRCRALAHLALAARDLGHGGADGESAAIAAFELLEFGFRASIQGGGTGNVENCAPGDHGK